jgi:hypothetical protein
MNISCGKDLYCDTAVYQCKLLPTLGAQCQQSSYRCKEPFFCNTRISPYVCAEPASVGEDCTSVPCYPDGFCDTVTRRCKPKLPDGAACTSSTECLSSICTVPAGGTTNVCAEKTVTVQCVGR